MKKLGDFPAAIDLNLHPGKKKARQINAGPFIVCGLQLYYVYGLRAFGAFFDVKLNLLPFS